ncbi:hypothetical protein KI387_024849 [Taxus chinensis]|uniref:Uncharacterized protein n=1 Tax=Taxus chinensis TaxID=29808 RepID=A0AA38LD53_TAXCH|nr:hypothetical protein KI387_024849 [Taxus chinensis]
MVKPSKEVGVGEQVVVKTDFVAAEEEQKEEADQQSVCLESSVHVGTLFEGNADSIQVTQSAIEEESLEEDLAVPTCPLEQQIEEFDLTNFVLEEEFYQEQDCLQVVEKGEATPDPKEEEHILVVEEKIVDPRALSTKQAMGEPLVLFSTSSLPSSSAEEEFDLSNSMLEVHENIEEMIERVANEPSVGLYFVQHHIHTAVPTLHRIKVKVIDATREVFICTQDMEDAINSLKSMQECGPPIVEQMIKKLNSSISLMSSVHQPRGHHQPVNMHGRSTFMSRDNAVLSTLGSAFQTASRAAWRSNGQDVQQTGGHISEVNSSNNQNNSKSREEPSTADLGTSTSLVHSVFKSALQRAGTLGWSSSSTTEESIDDGILTRRSDVEPLQVDVAYTHSPYGTGTHASSDSVPSTTGTVQIQPLDILRDPVQNNKKEQDNLLPVSSPSILQSNQTLERSERFEHFQAEYAAKLEAWLAESDEGSIASVQEYDLKRVV